MKHAGSPPATAAPVQPACRPRAGQAGRARGFTLIEVLVVLALFSLALLGLVAIQARAAQLSVGGEDSNRAALLANELAAAMWGANTVTLPAAAVEAWKARVADPTVLGLPNGSGSVTVSANVAQISVSWRAPQESATASHSYVTQVLIAQPAATP